MIISNDTFAVHFVEAEVRGDGEDSEEAEHEAHGGGGQQGGGGRGRGSGDGAAHRSWTSLNVHCQLLLFLGSSRPGSLLLSCVACHIQCKGLKSDKSCCTAPDCGDCRLAAVTTTRADLEKPTLL